MTRKNYMATAVRATVVAALIGGGNGASAQNSVTVADSENSDLVLEEMIVTARKFEERLQDAAVAVTMVSGTTLSERGIRDLSEITKLASSVKFDSDADVRAGVSIRGVGQSSDINAPPGVGMFIDGVYQPSSAYYTVPFFDVERIEILKGPQGTLYGKNTLGGAISIISREPEDELGGSLKVEGSSGSQVVANGVLNVPMVDDLGNRTAVFYRKSDGQFRNKTTGENAIERDDQAVRSTFVYHPDNGFRSALSLFYANLQSAPFHYSTTTKGLNHPINNVTKDVNGNTRAKYKSVNFTNSLELGAVTVSSLTSYDEAKNNTLVDADYTAAEGLIAGGNSDRDTFAQELRLASASDSNIQWLLGAYYSNDDVHTSSQTIIVAIDQELSLANKHETGDTYAGFGQVTWTLDEFEFVAGVRYDKETRDNSTTEVSSFPPPVVTRDFDGKVTSEEWQPKVSVSYHFTPDIMGYVLASKGFRAGGFNPITAPPEYDSFEPENTLNYEGGLKTELLGRRLRLNTAVFYTDYTDKLITDSVRNANGGGLTIISRNSGKAESYGAELDGAFKVSQSLTLSGGYTYLSIKNDEIPTGGVRREVSGFANNVFNLQADYFRPLANGMSFGAHVSTSYIGEMWMGREPEKRDAVNLVDASLDLNVPSIAFLENVTFTVFGKNVFNTKYYQSYISAQDAIVDTYALGLLNQPSQFGVRIAAGF